MLNEKGERELAYIVQIDEIKPIEGYDRVEYARVNGWWVIVGLNQFKVGDLAIYIEVDSRVPSDKEQFAFLEKRDYKVKTQKMCKVVSQGLLMSLSDFPELFFEDMVAFSNGKGSFDWCYKKGVKSNYPAQSVKIGDFLTKELGIIYYVAADNERKGKGPDKYAKMAARHSKLFKNNKLVQWLYKRTWGKKLLFFFLGKKKDNRGWPAWVVKTDEERCQNLPQLFPGDATKWIVTEKIDGSSTTFTMRGRGKKKEFYVCSRNVCFDTPEKAEKCYYESNIYLEMAEKYKIQEVLTDIMEKNPDLEFVTLQGETYGDGVQKRTYGLKDGQHDFMVFNLIFGNKGEQPERKDSITMTAILNLYKIPCVPILEESYQLPSTCEELLEYAEGESKLDGEMREGVVLRTQDGVSSFKAVSNAFLLKYHQ